QARNRRSQLSWSKVFPSLAQNHRSSDSSFLNSEFAIRDQLPAYYQHNFIIPGCGKHATADARQKAGIMKAILEGQCLLVAIDFFPVIQSSDDDFCGELALSSASHARAKNSDSPGIVLNRRRLKHSTGVTLCVDSSTSTRSHNTIPT